MNPGNSSGTPMNASSSNQLVLHGHETNASNAVQLAPQPIPTQLEIIARSSPRTKPSIAGFIVQCMACTKWRFIPTKEKYEEIREHIMEEPFFCEDAGEWRPDISCDTETDISEDDDSIWALDKPSIAKPPPGWDRLMTFRCEGCTRFADIYYITPTGRKLRSMVEIQKFLTENPEYASGVNTSKFSFQIPKPKQENYVRKRPARPAAARAARPAQPVEPELAVQPVQAVQPDLVMPISWANPEDVGLPAHDVNAASSSTSRPAKRQATGGSNP